MVENNANQKNLLSSDVHIKGELMFASELLFDGRLEGAIRTEGNLLIGENAQVQGDVAVGNVLVRGKVNGNIVAANKVDLRSRAELQGDITAARLVMDETVTFCGKIDVNPSRAPAGTAPAANGRPAGSPNGGTNGSANGASRPAVDPAMIEAARMAAAVAAQANGGGSGVRPAVAGAAR